MTTPPRRVDHAHVWATRPRPAAVEGASPAPAAAPASASDVGSALVLLNFPVRPDFVQQLWAAADVVVAADGACRKLYDSLSPPARERFLPAAIVGDMDSLDDEARAFYAARGVPVVQVEDQDTTDLFKCLEYLRAKQAETPGMAYAVTALGAFGGRLDHEMASLNSLYVYEGVFAHLALASEHCLACLLPAGASSIVVDQRFEGPQCGLIPLGVRVSSLTTRGLAWDVTGWASGFGGQMSTSNLVKGGLVEVDTSHPIVWTVSVRADAVCSRELPL